MLITRAMLRRMLLAQQGMLGERLPSTPMSWITPRGFLQLDLQTHALAAGHDLVLADRLQGYQVGDLDVALYNGRQLFEHCLHVPGILPAADYGLIYDGEAIAAVTQPGSLGRRILQLLESEGALNSHEIQGILQREGQHERRLVEQSIHQLFARGAILVRHREARLCTYDLAARVLPKVASRPPALKRGERQRALALRVLQVLAPVGLVTWSQALNAIGSRTRLDLNAMKRDKGRLIRELVIQGKAVQLDVEDPPQHYYVPASWLSILDHWPSILAPRVHLLSTMDPVVWDRQRALDLFGFDCRRQVHAFRSPERLPHNDCVLPILYGEALIGRIVSRINWASRRLLVEGVHLEDPSLVEDVRFRNAFAAALGELAALHGAREVQAHGPVPPRLIP